MYKIKLKLNRLASHNYSMPGTYFVTICVKDKVNLFWDKDALLNHKCELTAEGQIAAEAVGNIPGHYKDV
ncbi:MAG: hypothetical protein IJX93_01215, partial [Clostridia bacterium]|nr:hypothetical protein [Clostridia bacterium]